MVEPITEGLQVGDLKDLVLPLISIDEYEAKTGSDNDVIVTAFYVHDEEPARDLELFLEKSDDGILDTETSPAPNPEGYYLVFVEFLRNKQFPSNLLDVLKALDSLTEIKKWQFKPYKHEDIHELNEETLREFVKLELPPPDEKESMKQEEAFKFFKPSLLDNVRIHGKTLVFERLGQTARFMIKDYGNSKEMGEKYLSQNAIHFDEESLRQCRKITGMLGESWSVTPCGDVIALSNLESPNMLLLEGWLRDRNDPNHFTADASDMHRSMTAIRCPSCRNEISERDRAKFIEHRDRENDVTHWSGKCVNCGAKLTVWND